MKMWSTTPDDPRITEMDPVQKMWMYENWIADQVEKAELAKNHAYLLASFSHPEAVKQIVGDGNSIHTTDDEFEETSNMIKEMNLKEIESKPLKKRKRKILKE
tara:strand:- start:608 stop:916 length:309 start_codon:yes stop_codon:yes gene_type:complete